MPSPLPLTSERLERHGLYLIEDGQTMFLWVGRDAVPQLIMDVFDLPSYADLRGGKVRNIALPIRLHPLIYYLLTEGYHTIARQRLLATSQRCHF
jgi:hypothetical protein